MVEPISLARCTPRESQTRKIWAGFDQVPDSIHSGHLQVIALPGSLKGACAPTLLAQPNLSGTLHNAASRRKGYQQFLHSVTPYAGPAVASPTRTER